MNIEHISVSRYQVFVECKQKYKYRYHLAIKPDKPEPFYFTYGKIVHKIAEVNLRCAE
jgi:ATP-dependent helicase/DNAse subunit B